MNRIGTDRGFTLLELALAMAGLALLTTTAIPYFIRQAEVTAAQKTVKETVTIQEAAKWYYLSNMAWPSSVRSLKNARYLNPQWSASNPWGNSYSISSTARTFTVATTVPNSIGGVLLRALPGVSSSVNGNSRTIRSTVPLPGYERKLTEARNIAEEALSMAEESGVPPHGPTYLFGTKINGRATCPPGYAVVRTMALGGRNNIGYVCQSVVREGTRFPALLRQISQLESRNQQLRSQNRWMENRISDIEDYFEDNNWYRYWRRCVVNDDCDDD